MSITVPQAKQHLEYEDDDRDALIADYIAASKSWIENYTGQSMSAGSRTMTVPGFGEWLQLPVRPVQAITSIDYIGADDLPGAVATPRLLNDRIYSPVGGWPIAADYSAVTVTYQTGVSDYLSELQQAQRLMVGHWFANREAVDEARMAELPMAVEAICGRFHTPTLA